MKIKKASLPDLDALVPLFDGYRVFYKQTSDLTGARAFLKNHFESEFSVIFLAMDEGEAVGFTQLYPTFSSVSMEKFYILNDLYVLPERRGQQIGRALLQKAKDFTTAHKYKGLALATATDNPAQKLYESMAWEKDVDFFYYFWTNK